MEQTFKELLVKGKAEAVLELTANNKNLTDADRKSMDEVQASLEALSEDEKFDLLLQSIPRPLHIFKGYFIQSVEKQRHATKKR